MNGPNPNPQDRPPLSGAELTGPARAHFDLVVGMVREISLQTDPQAMISVFRKHTNALYGGDSSLSLSRRELESPRYRITRSTRWKDSVNPWTHPERLPLLHGGLLSELLYSDDPRILRDICVPTTDPAHEYLETARSLIALPLYDGGVALNMVVRMSPDPAAFDKTSLADAMLTANLFGRATNNLIVAQRLRKAYAELDHEMKRVAELQRSLLPPKLPDIPSLDIAVSYETARRAGGDYYDLLDLGDGRWGVLIADVSGHGTPAAVVMAMLRTMLHAQCYQCATPSELLATANRQLFNHSDRYDGTFVTAFYGIFDPRDRSLRYTCAGHNPPLWVDRNINVRELDEAQALPLAVLPDQSFPESTIALHQGDTLILYTDGITEAFNAAGEAYGRERLLSCVREDVPNAQHIIDCVVNKLIAFTGNETHEDDQTLLALRVL